MRIHRVFLPDLRAGERVLSAAESKHLLQVLRVTAGTPVRAFDGAGLEATGQVTDTSGLRVTVMLDPPEASPVEASLAVHAAVGVLKGDKLADVIRQLTELGAVNMHLFYSQHGDVNKTSPNKLERWQRVAKEAAKQSGRSVVPCVHAPVKLKDVPLEALSIVAHPYAKQTLAECVTPGDAKTITILTGPEGGFSEAEITALEARGVKSVRLGARILRAETAPVALCAALLLPGAL